MKRCLLIVLICVCSWGCERTYTYTYYEVVHRPDQLAVGDTIAIETKDGVSIRGTLVRVNEEELVLTTEGDERRRVPWNAVRVVQRIQRVNVKSG